MHDNLPTPPEFGVKWRGKFLRPSKHAFKEMDDLGMDLYDVRDVLDYGYDCSKGRRAKGTIERCIRKHKKIIRVVVVESYAYDINDSIWLIKHVGGR
jgi:hypothetical protein